MASDVPRLNWAKLLTTERMSKQPTGRAKAEPERAAWLINSRTETERDFDRVLFAAPTRRLGDKTQVFPLDRNESVRTRLTHSHEVANLARSIGTHIMSGPLGARIVQEAAASRDGTTDEGEVRRAVPAMLAAIGLGHDLGNPPFGHQGEEAIRSWIVRNEHHLFAVPEDLSKSIGHVKVGQIASDLGRLSKAHKADFTNFEGNAQTLRTLTRLQVVKDNRGLNLTFGTLAALMKYTVGSADTGGKTGPAYAKKVGFFQSEAALVATIRSAAGLPSSGLRHPLTHLMEACDDIAYLIVDAEDAIKKQIVSFQDLMAWLDSRPALSDDELTKWVCSVAGYGADEVRASGLPPSEQNDVSMQIFRANAMTAMVSAVIAAFEEQFETIMTTGIHAPLIDLSRARAFAKEMKEFDVAHAYRHRRVLEIELDGYNTIQNLMDMLWRGISERAEFLEPGSARTSPFARYAYGRISENYRRVFEDEVSCPAAPGSALPIRYRELQLLTDMVAGMTDQFAVDLHQELKRFNVGASAPQA